MNLAVAAAAFANEAKASGRLPCRYMTVSYPYCIRQTGSDQSASLPSGVDPAQRPELGFSV